MRKIYKKFGNKRSHETLLDKGIKNIHFGFGSEVTGSRGEGLGK